MARLPGLLTLNWHGYGNHRETGTCSRLPQIRSFFTVSPAVTVIKKPTGNFSGLLNTTALYTLNASGDTLSIYLQQYPDRGQVKGIAGRVDLNVFSGSLAGPERMCLQ
jgi:hypothetical protein